MYNSHMACVHKQYTLRCRHCSMPFASKSTLNQHMAVCMTSAAAGSELGQDVTELGQDVTEHFTNDDSVL